MEVVQVFEDVLLILLILLESELVISDLSFNKKKKRVNLKNFLKVHLCLWRMFRDYLLGLFQEFNKSVYLI